MPMCPNTYPRDARINPVRPRLSRTRAAARTDRFIEDLVLPDEEPAECRAVVEEWTHEFPPASAGDRVLLEQLAISALEKRRARRVRLAVVAEKVRTAAYGFDCEQQAEVEAAVAQLAASPAAAVARLNRTAAGTRYLIGRWERLKAIFDIEGTWYGQDRDEATRLQGIRSGKQHLAESETA